MFLEEKSRKINRICFEKKMIFLKGEMLSQNLHLQKKNDNIKTCKRKGENVYDNMETTGKELMGLFYTL